MSLLSNIKLLPLMLVVVLWATRLSAQPEALVVGDVEALKPVEVSVTGPAENFTGWTHELSFDLRELSTFSIRFRSLNIPSDAVFALEIRDRSLRVIQEWSQQTLHGRQLFWTAPIDGAYALVTLRVENLPEGQNLSFVMDALSLMQIEDAQLESIVGENDFQHMYELESDPLLTKAGRSVAKLSFFVGRRQYTCTGFMISDYILLTNEHCVNSQDICNTTTAVFGYKWIRAGTGFDLNIGEAFACEEYIYSNFPADWSLLKINGAAGAKDRWGHLTVAPARVAPNTPMFMIQHPAGYPKIVSKRDCRVVTHNASGRVAGLETDFGHSCDTVRGSSGAPMLSADLGVVVGQHHWGFDRSDPRWAAENRAIHVTELCVPKPWASQLPDWPVCAEPAALDDAQSE